MSTRIATQKRRAAQKLWKCFDEHLHAFIDGGLVLAISGGPDSRALLEAIATWDQRHRGPIKIITIDHGIRHEACAEANYVAMRARRLGFDSCVRRITSTSTGEHALRRARYDAIFAYARARNISTVVTAHQSNDNAEGYVMALMGVGGGELGAAMKAVERFEDVIVCRPFLSLSKQEILLSLTLDEHTDFARDRLDDARVGKRALIRHDVLPELQHYAPTLINRLESFARAQNQQRIFVESVAKELIDWQEDCASISLLAKPEPVLLVSALWQIIKRYADGKDLRSAGLVITTIAEDVFLDDIGKNPRYLGLDLSPNGFSLKSLGVKQYQVPGAVVFRAQSEIQVRRV